jgi:hypothetical protein
MRPIRQSSDLRSVSEPQAVNGPHDHDEFLFPPEGLVDAGAEWMRTALIVAGTSSAFGLAAIALYALQVPNEATAFASGVLFAGAAVVVGGFTGSYSDSRAVSSGRRRAPRREGLSDPASSPIRTWSRSRIGLPKSSSVSPSLNLERSAPVQSGSSTPWPPRSAVSSTVPPLRVGS